MMGYRIQEALIRMTRTSGEDPPIPSAVGGRAVRGFGACRRLVWPGVALLVAGMVAVGICAADARVASEYEIKAALVYKLALFVEWPAASLSNEKTPLILGILGNDPFGPHLRKATADKKVRGSPIVLRSCRDVEQAKGCHLLFVSSSEKANLSKILVRLRGQSILTVGDMEGFAAAGGIVNLLSERTVKFQINPDAAHRADLRISSQVLELAQIVRDSATPDATSK